MLEEYARNNNLPIPVHFTDDGISGTRFDRPGFMKMIAEVEKGNVYAVVIKDMSRLGRDHIVVGQYQEMFRQKGVRLIALNDNVDTFRGEDDLVPFRNIMNEWYAKDISKKINPHSRQRANRASTLQVFRRMDMLNPRRIKTNGLLTRRLPILSGGFSK